MDTQGLSQGSLRNSHRETHAIRRKPAAASFHELAKKLVESCSTDLIIRQRMDADRSEMTLKRGVFYVLENEGRADPGFLVFLPGKPVLYHQQRKGRPPQTWTLRMRVSPVVSEGGGSVLIATLDDVLHSLRLEDVWMWRGESIVGRVEFSKRREHLKDFVEKFWVPDARLLGGIFTTIAQPTSLEKFAEKGISDTCHSLEFIPEQAGRRRLVWYLEEVVRAAEAIPGQKKDRTGEGVTTAPRAHAAQVLVGPSAPSNSSRRVRAVPVDKMPDVYDLFGEDGLPISRASVQQFRVSQILRDALKRAGTSTLWVQAAWKPEFGGYEIQGPAESQL
jgi:hypothetical protein